MPGSCVARTRVAGDVLASSEELTLSSSYCWEDTKTGLRKGFGIIVTCPCSGIREFVPGHQGFRDPEAQVRLWL